MKVECKNCGNYFNGHYCNNCGQSADNHRLDIHFVWHELQHGLFHFDEGILYSFKQLYTRPGHSIREFIEGKRVNHFKPISLVIVLAAFYGLMYHTFGIDGVKPFVHEQSDLIDYHVYNEWISTHFSWLTLAGIPFLTFGTFICFRKQGYNFIEYFILNTYKASQRLFLHIATIPLLIMYNGTAEVKKILAFIYLADLALGFITNFQFFNHIPKWKTFYLSVLSHMIYLVCIFAVTLIVVELVKYF